MVTTLNKLPLAKYFLSESQHCIICVSLDFRFSQVSFQSSSFQESSKLTFQRTIWKIKQGDQAERHYMVTDMTSLNEGSLSCYKGYSFCPFSKSYLQEVNKWIRCAFLSNRNLSRLKSHSYTVDQFLRPITTSSNIQNVDI